jgi:hypothetical protein
MFYVILDIKLFVIILLFIVKHDLNNYQTYLVRSLTFPKPNHTSHNIISGIYQENSESREKKKQNPLIQI